MSPLHLTFVSFKIQSFILLYKDMWIMRIMRFLFLWGVYENEKLKYLIWAWYYESNFCASFILQWHSKVHCLLDLFYFLRIDLCVVVKQDMMGLLMMIWRMLRKQVFKWRGHSLPRSQRKTLYIWTSFENLVTQTGLETPKILC